MKDNKQLIKDFKKLVSENNLSHAYLFFGEAKNEKFIFALSLANYLENKNFEQSENGAVLSECFVISSEEKGIIGIDDVKKLSNFLYQKPVLSEKRTAIIKDAETLTSEAQNAALKIVEDSPQGALIIFIVKDENSILTPLASRLQKIYFSQTGETDRKLNGKILKASIEEIVENDKIDEYFENLIAELRKNPVKNLSKMREALKRLTLIKKFNTNKKLQLRCLS